MIPIIQLVRRLAWGRAASDGDIARISEQNLGHDLGEWPERAAGVVTMLDPYRADIGPRAVVADWGCGRQTVRRLLPPEWSYLPYDRIQRSADTRLHDFNVGLPAESADVVLCLGLLEYVDDFWSVLGGALDRSRYCLFSHVGPSSAEKQRRNGWRWNVEFDEIETFLASRGSVCLSRKQSRAIDALFVARGLGSLPASTA